MSVTNFKERPILFSAPMVNAILEGRKTQTRRVMTVQPPDWYNGHVDIASKDAFAVWLGETESQDESHGGELKFPYGNIGDSLWVRENIRFGKGYDGVKPKDIPKEPHIKRWYEADTGMGEVPHGFGVIRPSIFMPRYFSRITLDITRIRVELLRDISEEDAKAEGVPENMTYVPVQICQDAMEALKAGGHTQFIDRMVNPPIMQDWRAGFQRLWQSINGKDSWNQNPWVWVIEFKRRAQV